MPIALATASVSFVASTASAPVRVMTRPGATIASFSTVTQLTVTAAPTPTPSLD